MENILTVAVIYAQESVDVVEQSGNISFISILLGTLTPALLFAIAYMLIRMFNKK
jgi:hypothetical protein